MNFRFDTGLGFKLYVEFKLLQYHQINEYILCSKYEFESHMKLRHNIL